MSCLPASHSEELVLSRGVRDSSEGPSPPNMANVSLPPEGFWVLEPWVSPAPESAKETCQSRTHIIWGRC